MTYPNGLECEIRMNIDKMLSSGSTSKLTMIENDMSVGFTLGGPKFFVFYITIQLDI